MEPIDLSVAASDESTERDDDVDESGTVIKSNVTIHDRNQVEFVFDYSFEGRTSSKPQPAKERFSARDLKAPLYEVEAYFFFPPQMGISSNLYTKRQFYDDVRPLFRLREPRFGYRDYIGSDSQRVKTPIQRLEALLIQSRNQPLGVSHTELCLFQARLFACTFSNFLMRRVQRRTRKMDRIAAAKGTSLNAEVCAQLIARCEVLVEKALRVVQKWEHLVTGFQDAIFADAHSKAQLLGELRLVAEFCHYKLSEGVARMAAHYRDSTLIERGLKSQAEQIQRKLGIWSRWHQRQGRKKGYLAIDEKASIEEQEQYFFRRGDLKRRMWQILYLDLEPRQSLEMQKQIAYMIAAGAAASWAFFAQVLISYQLNFSGSASNLDSLLSASGLAILLAFIGAYILKDRIKDIGREWFKSGLFGKAPDFSYRVWFDNLGRYQSIGNIVEHTEFFSHEKVPKAILEKRKELPSHLVSFNERIVAYHQKLDLAQMDEVSFLGPIWAVRSIFRFNLRRYLDYLDDSVQKHAVLNRRGEICTVRFPKVYHLDVVMRYAYTDEYGKRNYVGFDCNRLIVDKEGLIRVENPTAAKPSSYS